MSGEVVRHHPEEARFFAEGLALVDDELIQLTYREGTAFVYDRITFEEIRRHSYDGEGWGLCYDGAALWMSNGSSSLQRRDPRTFALISQLDVSHNGYPVERLNELECVGTHVYANVWLTTHIIRIDTTRGRVDALVDASALVPTEPQVRAQPNSMLNGIAHDSSVSS